MRKRNETIPKAKLHGRGYIRPLPEPGLNIALKDWREVYLLSSAPQRLLPEVHRGKLVYRARGSRKRVSCERIKKGLVKKATRIWLHLPF